MQTSHMLKQRSDQAEMLIYNAFLESIYFRQIHME